MGGEVNPSREARATQTSSNAGFDGLYSGGTIHDLQGALINLRGSATLYSGALGGIDPRYDTLLRDPAEVRNWDAFSPTLASATGGLTLVAGDTGMRLETRGDLVLGGVTDPGRVGVPNTVGFTAPDGSVYQGGGIGWFQSLDCTHLGRSVCGGRQPDAQHPTGRGDQCSSYGGPKPVAQRWAIHLPIDSTCGGPGRKYLSRSLQRLHGSREPECLDHSLLLVAGTVAQR